MSCAARMDKLARVTLKSSPFPLTTEPKLFAEARAQEAG